jgi:predicted  nucleic acid-binding Zn-ribbon protein
MKRIRLEEKEYKTIGVIIDQYREIESSLTRVQEELDKLDKEQVVLLEKLEKIRNQENSFFEKVEKKHGEGKLDLMTMDYLVKS